MADQAPELAAPATDVPAPLAATVTVARTAPRAAAGDSVILQHGSDYAFAVADTAKKVRLGKMSCDAVALVGAAYGSVFTADRNRLVLSAPDADTTAAVAVANSAGVAPAAAEASGVADNRNLFDNNSSQKLSQDEISKLRRTGADGVSIVSALVEGSATFKDKTTFSQEKYIKKKLKKHVVQVRLLEPSAFNIATASYHDNPAKIGYLRPDMLTRMMYMSAVRGGTRAMVCENCGGLLLGAVAERVSSVAGGVVVNVHTSAKPEGIQLLRYFRKDSLAPIEHVPIARLLPKVANTAPAAPAATEDSAPATEEAAPAAEAAPKVEEQPKEEAEKELAPVDSLLIACKYRPMEVVKALLPCLRPAQCFVVFSPYMQPLVDVAREITAGSALACHVDLAESFFREIQVLPDRTHPFVDMDGHPGYVLSGIRVAPRQQPANGSRAAAAPEEQEAEEVAAPAAPEDASEEPASKRARLSVDGDCEMPSTADS